MQINPQELNIVERSFLLASRIHAKQERKAALVPHVPYLAHLMAVASLVAESGAPQTVVAAALLHDAIEDHGGQCRVPIGAISAALLSLVEECTEEGTGEGTKPPWIQRKLASIQKIGKISVWAFIIVLADRLHNARCLAQEISNKGQVAFNAFNAPKADIVWFHGQVAQAFGERLPLLREHRSYTAMEAMYKEFVSLVEFFKRQ